MACAASTNVLPFASTLLTHGADHKQTSRGFQALCYELLQSSHEVPVRSEPLGHFRHVSCQPPGRDGVMRRVDRILRRTAGSCVFWARAGLFVVLAKRRGEVTQSRRTAKGLQVVSINLPA